MGIIVENIINGVRVELPKHIAEHPTFAKNFTPARNTKPKVVIQPSADGSKKLKSSKVETPEIEENK